MTARWVTGDVFDGLATLPDASVDVVISSPPFLALRSYLPQDHPDKSKEIGSEATPAEFLDVLLRVTAELRRVLAPHGSICIELGDTYAGGGGDNNLYTSGYSGYAYGLETKKPTGQGVKRDLSAGWPLAKSKTLIPELYRIALAYGFNPLTGAESPAGRWRVRNVVTWARPNPPVGALGDKWRPATSDLVVACVSDKRYWDDLATRRSVQHPGKSATTAISGYGRTQATLGPYDSETQSAQGAPLLDYWEIPPTGYSGSHYAVFPPALVEPCVKAMCPERVCRVCGEPSRRITEMTGYERGGVAVENLDPWPWGGNETGRRGDRKSNDGGITRQSETLGWSDCGHDDWRPGLVLDPFAGSGTTLLVATGHGRNAIGFDLDSRNAVLARDRVGPFLFEEATQ